MDQQENSVGLSIFKEQIKMQLFWTVYTVVFI